jgi:hypothetical protein
MPGRSLRTHMIKAETTAIDAGEISAAKKNFHGCSSIQIL